MAAERLVQGAAGAAVRRVARPLRVVQEPVAARGARVVGRAVPALAAVRVSAGVAAVRGLFGPAKPPGVVRARRASWLIGVRHLWIKLRSERGRRRRRDEVKEQVSDRHFGLEDLVRLPTPRHGVFSQVAQDTCTRGSELQGETRVKSRSSRQGGPLSGRLPGHERHPRRAGKTSTRRTWALLRILAPWNRFGRGAKRSASELGGTPIS